MARLDSLFGAVTEQLGRERADLEAREQSLQKERENLDAEKAAMLQDGSLETDVMELNVGGESLAALRSTLLLAPEGSMLHSMFSGRWDASLSHDAQGRVFLDFTPHLFRKVLSHLRTLRLASSRASLKPPAVEMEHQQEFQVMVDYLGLKELFCARAHMGSQAPSGRGRSKMELECVIPHVGATVSHEGRVASPPSRPVDACVNVAHGGTRLSSGGWAGDQEMVVGTRVLTGGRA